MEAWASHKSFRRKDGSDNQNRNGLIAAAMATQADGLAERDAALLMLKEKQESCARRLTEGADEAYDSEDFVGGARALNVTPHIVKKRRRTPLQRWTRGPPGTPATRSDRAAAGWSKELRLAEGKLGRCAR